MHVQVVLSLICADTPQSLVHPAEITGLGLVTNAKMTGLGLSHAARAVMHGGPAQANSSYSLVVVLLQIKPHPRCTGHGRI